MVLPSDFSYILFATLFSNGLAPAYSWRRMRRRS